MDFGEEDTNNPFVTSSDDQLHDIDGYFGVSSVFTRPVPPIDPHLVSNHQIVIHNTTSVKGTVYYTVECTSKGTSVQRRYSDFQSLRANLVRFFPSKLIPLIPEKHSLKDYLYNGGSNGTSSRSHAIVEFRKRRFTRFLNRLVADLDISLSVILSKFLDPQEEVWVQLLKYPPFSQLPNNILLSSPRTPTTPNPYYSYLPLPSMLALKNFDSDLNRVVFKPLELQFLGYKNMCHRLESHLKKIVSNYKDLAHKKIELGATFNIFSLTDNSNNILLEKIGQCIDLDFINQESLLKNLLLHVKEPLHDIKLQTSVALNLLSFRKFKDLQLTALEAQILKKQSRAKLLIKSEYLHLKIDSHLDKSLVLPPQGGKKHLFNLFAGRKATQIKDSQSMSTNERLHELDLLLQDLTKLQSCHQLLSSDLNYLNVEIEKNCLKELKTIKIDLFNCLKTFELKFLVYLKELNLWDILD